MRHTHLREVQRAIGLQVGLRAAAHAKRHRSGAHGHPPNVRRAQLRRTACPQLHPCVHDRRRSTHRPHLLSARWPQAPRSSVRSRQPRVSASLPRDAPALPVVLVQNTKPYPTPKHDVRCEGVLVGSLPRGGADPYGVRQGDGVCAPRARRPVPSRLLPGAAQPPAAHGDLVHDAHERHARGTTALSERDLSPCAPHLVETGWDMWNQPSSRRFNVTAFLTRAEIHEPSDPFGTVVSPRSARPAPFSFVRREEVVIGVSEVYPRAQCSHGVAVRACTSGRMRLPMVPTSPTLERDQ